MGYLDEYNKLKKKREEEQQKIADVAKKAASKSTSTTNNSVSVESTGSEVKESNSFLDVLSNLGTAFAKGQYYQNGGMYQSPEQQKAMNDFFDEATVKTKSDDKKWFNSGLFADGYQFGDVSKTILGTGADLAEDALTGIIGMGETIVDVGAYVAPLITQGQFYQNGGAYQSPEIQKAFNQTISQAKKDNAEFIEKDLYDANAIAKKLISEVPGALQMSNINQSGGFATAEDWERNRQMQIEAEEYINNTMEKESVLGEKSDALAQSAGQLVATMALQGLGVPWWLTTGATSFGAEAENALRQGATYEEAGLSATITAGAEILTEKISGGIKFGGKTLDEGLTRELSRIITDKTIRTLAKVGMDVAGEGGEEVLSGYLSAIGQKLTYADEKTMGELFSSEDAMDAFIGGAILGGVSSTGQAVIETKKGNDYASGLTNSEKAVVDKVYEDKVAARETDGKKLTEKEKSQIYDDTLNELEKGYIDTDTIESVLGGETYKTYKDTVDSEAALQKEYDELYNMKNGEKSDAQIDRQKELKKQLDEIKSNSNRTQLREKLDNDMLGIVQGSKLSESYNEKDRRKQVFEADLTQYDSKQAEVVKKAVESGILNNTNKTHDFVDMIAKVSAEKGVSFDFLNNQKLKESGFALEGKTVNGFVKDGNISINIDSAKALNTVVGHEITHVLEGTEFYPELQKIAKKYAETKGEYEARLDAIKDLYKGIDGADVEAELTADLIGDYLFTDADFINRLSTENRNVFQKIYDEIKYLYKVATAGSKEARQLEKVKKAFDKAYREGGTTTSDTTKYALSEVDGTAYVTAEKNLFVKEDGTLASEKEVFNSLVGQTLTLPDGEVEIVKRLPGKDMHNELVRRYPKNLGGIEDVKALNSDVNYNMKELLENSEALSLNEEDKGEKHKEQGIIGFDTRTVNFYDGEKAYEIQFSIATLQDGRKVAYAKKFFGYDAELTKKIQTAEARSKQSPLNQQSVSDNSLPQNSEKSSGANSLSAPGEQNAPVGNYNVFGKDIALEQDIGPVVEVAPTTEVAEPFAEEYAPLTEAEANERDDAQMDRKYFLDQMAPEPETPIYNEDVIPESPFDERDFEDVGSQKVKAYMYENPEVKPFFQEEARIMLSELDNSVKGERVVNANMLYETGGEFGVYGTKRMTSEAIAYLRDSKYQYTYEKIREGLNAIIKDHGAENNAISKRIEFLLDERLREGYTDTIFTGEKIPPNQEYLNLLIEKQITEYNDEAWDNYVRGASDEEIKQYFAVDEEVVPPVTTQVTNEPEIAPVKEDVPLYEDASGQQTMFENVETEPTLTRSVLHSNIIANIKNTFAAKGLDLDNVLKKAKNLSTFATVDNTPQRVMEKSLGYKEGQILSDLTVNQVAQNETEGTKWLNSFTNRSNGLLAQISKQYNIKPGSKKSAAAQMYAEGFYVDEENNIIAYGDAELAKDFPDAKVQADIKGLANDPRIRKIYDDTLARINESRKRNAYPEIPRLDNYFLHFRAMEDTFSRLGLPFNPNDIKAKDLPTDLNGVTADLKPGQPYFASAMHRTGQRTSFDLLGGLERYLSSAKNQIYHIDDIQTFRALRNYIADTYGQAHGLENLDTLSEEEAQERIEEVYGSHLSTFAKFLNEEANVLAGKTTLIDRGLEGIIGRRGITFLDTINRQVGSNMVGFNISSSMTNFLSVTQAFAKTQKRDFVKAFAQTVYNKVGSLVGRNDGFTEQNPVMIRRKGADRFYRTPWQKVGDSGYVLMSAVDDISTELIARTKYNELTRKGMDSQKAHYETDKWVSRLMGDRSLGQQPQLYNSKMLGIVTKFQLEVRNQLDAQFYDTIQEAKVSNEEIQNGLARNMKTAAKVTSTLVQLAVVQHLFGKAFESVAGYNPAFDIISAILTAVGYDDDEESEDTVLDNIEQGFLELLGDLPYTSTFTGGRIPISSALPIEQLVTGKDDYGNEKSRWETIKEAAPYYVLPTGYGQIKKTYQGLSMFDDDLPIAGSYTDSGNLRFTVEDTLPNRLQAGVFGQWASGNARDYFDNERNSLKKNQIEELVDLDIPIKDYWEYREGLAEQETLEDKFDYIAGLDASVEQKNIMINNIVDRKEKVDMSNYDDFSGYEEFDFYAKNTEKYNFLQDNGISYSEYMSSDDAKKEYDSAYSWYKNNPEKVTVSKAVTDNVIEYRKYTSDLNDIRADKDADGDSIPGSAKAKKVEYINNLDLDYGQKIILFRSLYSSQEDKDTYNAEIVEYLNGRDDISYLEMLTILNELDMKVLPDGTVEW